MRTSRIDRCEPRYAAMNVHQPCEWTPNYRLNQWSHWSRESRLHLWIKGSTQGQYITRWRGIKPLWPWLPNTCFRFWIYLSEICYACLVSVATCCASGNFIYYLFIICYIDCFRPWTMGHLADSQCWGCCHVGHTHTYIIMTVYHDCWVSCSAHPTQYWTIAGQSLGSGSGSGHTMGIRGATMVWLEAVTHALEFHYGMDLKKVARTCLYLWVCCALVRLSVGTRLPSACTATRPVTISYKTVNLMSRRRSFKSVHFKSFWSEVTLLYRL